MSELTTKTLTELRDMLASGSISATEATQACLDRIAATEDRVGAFTSVQAEAALDYAKALDAEGPQADKPLWGVPVSVKDILATKDAPTTCASKILENFTPFYDATAVARLREAGAVIIGKTNMDEFAMGSSTENSAFGVTRNPWDTTRIPGGSSGGSAASVAAGQCFGSLGTDTGGSIRQPASFCGCVGLKPTYGRVSRYGCVAYASSLDQIGPLTRSVPDAALLLSAIAGYDERDSTSVDCPVPDYVAAANERQDLTGVRLGMPKEYWANGLAPEVEKGCRAAIKRAEELGAELVPVDLPHTKYGIASYYIIAMAEASSNLARFDGVRYGKRAQGAHDLIDMYTASRSEGFGDEVKRRIMLGTYVLSAGYYDAYYRKAAQVRRLVRQDYLDAFEQCDIICGPASPVTAWGLEEKTDDPLQMYLMDVYTISLNLAGLPGISLPVGLGEDTGMPVGLQLLGPAFAEDRLLAASGALMRGLDPLPAPKGLE
jgi:aspartyl-tRNA(Asn)/glutamyl-tRNA(Gln) amidotransferase subunit A